jgi:hypothetical protein
VENLRARSIIITMAVTFSVSFAFMMWQRKSQDRMASIPAAAQAPAVEAPTMAPPQPPPQYNTSVVAMAPVAPVRPMTAANTPPLSGAANQGEETPAPPLPISFHIADRRDLNRVDGEIRNNSSTPLSLTLTAVNAKTQGTTEMHMDLEPGETKPYSTDDGLVMYARDQLIVHSPSFQDRIVKIP